VPQPLAPVARISRRAADARAPGRARGAWLLPLLAGCAPLVVEFGAGPGDTAVLPGADLDQDGVPAEVDCDDGDPGVGAPGAEAWNGLDDDCDGTIDDLAVGEVALGAVGGSAADTRLGASGSLGFGGDATGDGVHDLLLGSWAGGAGIVWLVDGAVLPGASEPVSRLYTWQGRGEDVDYPVGWTAGSMGDVNGDDVADLLFVGTDPGDTSVEGRAYLVLGGASLQGTGRVDQAAIAGFEGDSDGDRLWRSVLEDVDGDGLDDMLVGSPYDQYRAPHDPHVDLPETGNVALFLGEDLYYYASYTVSLGWAKDQVHGNGSGDHFGWSLTAADLDGDGYADVIAGAPDAPGREREDERDRSGELAPGRVYVLPGNRSGEWNGSADEAARYSLAGGKGAPGAGAAMPARPGDLDGDGSLDLAVAAPGSSIAVVYGAGARRGRDDWEDADGWIAVGADCGTALAADVDVDGDGRDELLVGCPDVNGGAAATGAVWVYAGSTLVATLVGEAAGDQFGAALSYGVDLDADGRDEVLVGAPGSDRDGTEAGAVYLVGR